MLVFVLILEFLPKDIRACKITNTNPKGNSIHVKEIVDFCHNVECAVCRNVKRFRDRKTRQAGMLRQRAVPRAVKICIKLIDSKRAGQRDCRTNAVHCIVLKRISDLLDSVPSLLYPLF